MMASENINDVSDGVVFSAVPGMRVYSFTKIGIYDRCFPVRNSRNSCSQEIYSVSSENI